MDYNDDTTDALFFLQYFLQISTIEMSEISVVIMSEVSDFAFLHC